MVWMVSISIGNFKSNGKGEEKEGAAMTGVAGKWQV